MCPQEILFVIFFKLEELANVRCHELLSSVLGAELDFISSLMLIANTAVLFSLFLFWINGRLSTSSCIHYSGYRYLLLKKLFLWVL